MKLTAILLAATATIILATAYMGLMGWLLFTGVGALNSGNYPSAAIRLGTFATLALVWAIQRKGNQ